ncbi:MAG: hypothetical protein V3T30_04635 [Thermodesulfobacteriota bacterium]
MVQIDIPAAFVFSQLFLDLGRKVIMKESAEDPTGKPAVYYRYLFRTVFLAGLVVAPCGIYLLTGWPGWEQLYWTDIVEAPHGNMFSSFLYALFIIAIVIAAWLGHVIGYRWLVTGKGHLLRPTYIIITILVCGGVLILNYPAYTLVGTYHEYHFDRAAMGQLWDNAENLGTSVILVSTYYVLALIYAVFQVLSERKKYPC